MSRWRGRRPDSETGMKRCTSLYLVESGNYRTVEMQRQLDIAAACQVPVVNNLENRRKNTTIVDAIFGVGLSRPVEGSYRDVIMALNQLNAWKWLLIFRPE